MNKQSPGFPKRPAGTLVCLGPATCAVHPLDAGVTGSRRSVFSAPRASDSLLSNAKASLGGSECDRKRSLGRISFARRAEPPPASRRPVTGPGTALGSPESRFRRHPGFARERGCNRSAGRSSGSLRPARAGKASAHGGPLRNRVHSPWRPGTAIAAAITNYWKSGADCSSRTSRASPR